LRTPSTQIDVIAAFVTDLSDIATFKEKLPDTGSLMGLDLGTKTIGVATSDSRRTIATPLDTIRRRKFAIDLAALIDIIQNRQICGTVIGLPLNMDGSSGPRVQATHAFVRNISGKIATPILLWDERLSTAAVTRTLLEADTSRKKRGEVVDKMAAAYILQGALDRLASI